MNRKTIAVLATFVAAACSSGEAVEAPTRNTAQVTTGNLRLTAEATGTVEPIREIEVKSRAGGEIQRLYVDVGDEVEPGALLVEIDPRDVRTTFNQAKADYDVAQARLEISEAQLNRSRELYAAGFITQQELENAELEYANTQAAFVRAESNMDLAELQLADVTIRAPMAGTILSKSVEEGVVIQSASGNVSGGTTLFVMAELARMQVRTMVDETDMGDLRAGMSANVTVEAFPDQTFRGVVEKIEPRGENVQNVTMFPVIVTLDNSSGLLKPMMNAEVEILIDQATNVMLVPNGAVVPIADAMAAAMALGIDPETLDMSAMRGGFSRGGAAGGQGGAPTQGAGAEGGAASSEAPAAGAQDMQTRIAELRQKVESGEISQDSLRTVMASMRPASGGTGMRAAGPTGDSGAEIATKPGVVFVMVDGQPQLRMVQLGLSDWDSTQIVSGLEGNEELAVIGAAQLMASQQAAMERMRSRMGGGGPFGR